MTQQLPSRSDQRKAAVACIIGNFLEYFDFALFGFFAVAIGGYFFPSTSPTAQLLNSLAVFGVAFAMRPLGGVIFGLIGDRAGRRTSLSISIALMGIATAVIGLLPGYAALGIASPIILVLIRCIQGISVGGEWGASSAFLIETAPEGKRGIRGSFPSMAAALGLAGGSLLALGMALVLTESQLNGWGWRVPFLLAAPLGALGLYIRLRLEDTPIFKEIERTADQRPRARVRDAFRREHWRALGITFCFSWICGVGLFYLGSYVVNFLSSTAGLPQAEASMFAAIGLIIYAALCPLAGRISDLVGRRKTILFGCIGHAVMAVPMFWLMSWGQAVPIMIALVVYAIIQAPINANTSLILIELFPASTRLTAGSIGFNLGVGPPSGFGPLVAAGLVASTGLGYSPGFFLAGVAIFCGIVLYYLLPETAGRNLLLEHDATRDQALAGAAAPANPLGGAHG